MTCEGRLVWPAILVMEMELVLDARTASGLTTCPHRTEMTTSMTISSHADGGQFMAQHAAAGFRLPLRSDLQNRQ